MDGEKMNKFLMLGLMLFAQMSFADAVKVVDVKIKPQAGQQVRIDVTLLHADTGWEHYADGWQVLDENKKVIATRVLYHPHVSEQPFTRSLSGVVINKKARFIYIRAHDKVHGNSELKKIDLN